jgi:hypothetical protein
LHIGPQTISIIRQFGMETGTLHGGCIPDDRPVSNPGPDLKERVNI